MAYVAAADLADPALDVDHADHDDRPRADRRGQWHAPAPNRWADGPHARRGNTGPVYPSFGKDIRDGIDLAIENYALLHRLWRVDVVPWTGRLRTLLLGFMARHGRWTAYRHLSGTA